MGPLQLFLHPEIGHAPFFHKMISNSSCTCQYIFCKARFHSCVCVSASRYPSTIVMHFFNRRLLIHSFRHSPKDHHNGGSSDSHSCIIPQLSTTHQNMQNKIPAIVVLSHTD